MANKYQNGLIYAIRSHQTEEVYVGSTVQTLAQRMSGHRRGFKRYRGGKGNYVTSFEILKHPDAYIELLEACPCDTKAELHRREGQLMREMPCVNRCIAGRTHEAYRQENREVINAKQNRTRMDNPVVFAAKRAEYEESNKEAIAATQKLYQQKNREEILAKKKEKITCECGTTHIRHVRAKHRRSARHHRLFEAVTLAFIYE
jgi:hypothetical protein